MKKHTALVLLIVGLLCSTSIGYAETFSNDSPIISSFYRQLELLQNRYWELRNESKAYLPSSLSQQVALTAAAQTFSGCEVVPVDDFPVPVKQKKVTDTSSLLLDAETREIGKHARLKAKNSKTFLSEKALADLIRNRKKHLVETMRTNPQLALHSVLTQVERDAISTAKNCFETPVTEEGTLDVLHRDFFEEGTADTIYHLTTQKGERLRVYPSQVTDGTFISNAYVRIKGYRVDNNLLVDGNDKQAISSIQKQANNFRFMEPSTWFSAIATSFDSKVANAAIPDAQGVQKTIVLLAYFQDTPQPIATKAEIDAMVFGQLNNYFTEVSYGKMSISGVSNGWYKLPINQTNDLYVIRAEAVKAAEADVLFTDYSRMIILAPISGITGTLGKQTFPTGDGLAHMSTAWMNAAHATSSVGFYAHEFGHNLGVHHANFLNCGSVSIATTGCVDYEYGDRYSVMGGNNGHYNAPHKEYIGWFDANQAVSVATSGTYVLDPIETISGGLKMIKLRRTVSDYLYVEYRQPIGFDSGIGAAADVFSGGLFHTLYSSIKTHLIDTTPPANSAYATLPIGATFTDPATGSKVTVAERTPQNLTVSVVTGKTDFVAPLVTLTSPIHNTIVSGIMTVSANASDASGIQRVEFYRTSGETSVMIASDNEAPYSAELDTITYPNGSSWIFAIAYDNSGTAFGAQGNEARSNSALVSIDNGTDTTPPTTSISAPVSGSTIGSPVTVQAIASDNVSVYRVEFWKGADTTPFAIDYTFPYSATATLAMGAHTVASKAFDAAGNTTSSVPVTFNVSDTSPPSTTITSPVNGTVVSRRATITIAATATDNQLVNRVEFFVNGALKCTDATAPYTCAWKVPNLNGQVYQIQSKAYDGNGNMSTSAIVSVSAK